MDQQRYHVTENIEIEAENTSAIKQNCLLHKTFEDRLAEYNNRISVCRFDWGEPKGREIL